MVSIVFIIYYLLFVLPFFVLGVICVHDLNFPMRRWNTADGFELMRSTMI